jgi:parallel beta-helix repeat protein
MKTKTVHSAILLSVLLMASLFMALEFTLASSEPNTITVPDDYEKIQEAVNAANSGDRIIVKAGTYNEDLVSINKSVSLVGDNQKSLVYYHSTLGFIVTANNVHISGFKIMSSEAMQGYAVSMSNSSECVIENNWVTDNLVGISVYGLSSGNTFSGNVLENNERSIELIDSPDNTISDNNITGALVSGISLDSSSGNTVSGNRISDLKDGMGALMLWKSSNNVISRNLLFCGNPMLMIDCSNNVLSENFVIDSEYGIVVGLSSNNKIYSNYFINVTEGIMDTEIGAGVPSENSWDNGAEGNYWCNYAGADADGDGIGDSPQVLCENNQDNYPLMGYPPISTNPATDSPDNTSTDSTLPTETIYGIVAAVAVILVAVAVWKLRKK